jgi:hypothetical protein
MEKDLMNFEEFRVILPAHTRNTNRWHDIEELLEHLEQKIKDGIKDLNCDVCFYIRYNKLVFSGLGLFKPSALDVAKISFLFKVFLLKESDRDINRRIIFVCCCPNNIYHLV